MKDLKEKKAISQHVQETHYSQPSMYGKMCKEQYAKQPKYCETGTADGNMKAEHSNKQAGA